MANSTSTGSPTPRARERKHAKERQALIRAAFRYLGHEESQRGFVMDVLADTGLSTRAFYRHFASRDELVVAMFKVESERVTAWLTQIVAEATTGVEALHDYVYAFLSVAYEPRRAARVRALSSPDGRSVRGRHDLTNDDARDKRAILHEVFVRGIADGTLRGAQPIEDSFALQALVTAYVDARMTGADVVTFHDAVEHTVKLFSRS
jgi:AcrR family transcriptional regulator